MLIKPSFKTQIQQKIRLIKQNQQKHEQKNSKTSDASPERHQILSFCALWSRSVKSTIVYGQTWRRGNELSIRNKN